MIQKSGICLAISSEGLILETCSEYAQHRPVESGFVQNARVWLLSFKRLEEVEPLFYPNTLVLKAVTEVRK